MKEMLEGMSAAIDAVFKGCRVDVQVAGGYVAGSGFLFSLTKPIFPSDEVAGILASIFMRKVFPTVGVLLVGGNVNGVAFHAHDSNMIDGEIVLPEIETVDLMTLIDSHHSPTLPLPASL